MKITVTHDDGTSVEITEGVQVLYDSLINSLDYTSGFLSSEELGQIGHVGQACRFADFEGVVTEAALVRKKEERRQAERVQRAAIARRIKEEGDAMAEQFAREGFV